jgi:hypothetical protein
MQGTLHAKHVPRGPFGGPARCPPSGGNAQLKFGWDGIGRSDWSGLVWSGLVWSGLVWSGLVWSGLVITTTTTTTTTTTPRDPEWGPPSGGKGPPEHASLETWTNGQFAPLGQRWGQCPAPIAHCPEGAMCNAGRSEGPSGLLALGGPLHAEAPPKRAFGGVCLGNPPQKLGVLCEVQLALAKHKFLKIP